MEQKSEIIIYQSQDGTIVEDKTKRKIGISDFSTKPYQRVGTRYSKVE